MSYTPQWAWRDGPFPNSPRSRFPVLFLGCGAASLQTALLRSFPFFLQVFLVLFHPIRLSPKFCFFHLEPRDEHSHYPLPFFRSRFFVCFRLPLIEVGAFFEKGEGRLSVWPGLLAPFHLDFCCVSRPFPLARIFGGDENWRIFLRGFFPSVLLANFFFRKSYLDPRELLFSSIGFHFDRVADASPPDRTLGFPFFQSFLPFLTRGGPCPRF